MPGLLILLLYVALFGFIVYLIVTYIPMPAPFKQIIMVIAAILLIIWLISSVGGGFGSMPSFRTR